MTVIDRQAERQAETELFVEWIEQRIGRTLDVAQRREVFYFMRGLVTCNELDHIVRASLDWDAFRVDFRGLAD